MNGLMVVDDEEGVRRSLKKVLERDGYRIVLAENGEEALSIIRSDGRDIETVISDYRMPGMDGLETLIEIGRLNAEITRSIKKRLKQFVSEQVLIELQRSGTALIPKRLRVSILFTDIRGFTNLSQRLNPAELSELLNCHYFSPLDNIIFRHNGTLDKHIGDSIMGIFGAPVGGGDDAFRAVEAALAIRDEIVVINGNISDAERKIAVGIGIATGEVMAGIFGSPRKKEYTVFGTPVNLASRLENLARANEILICGETALLVGNFVNMEKIPSPVIRGLARPPDVFSVLGKK
jgi:adenylate cyclase